MYSQTKWLEQRYSQTNYCTLLPKALVSIAIDVFDIAYKSIPFKNGELITVFEIASNSCAELTNLFLVYFYNYCFPIFIKNHVAY